jgi:predicted Zn-dependent protease
MVAIHSAPGRCWRFQFAAIPQRSAPPCFQARLGLFRVLSVAEAAEIPPLRLRAHQARRGETVAALARSMPLARAAERLRLMNGLRPDEQVQPGQWVGLIAE